MQIGYYHISVFGSDLGWNAGFVNANPVLTNQKAA